MDKRYPDSRRFSSATEIRAHAEGLVNGLLTTTDDAFGGAASDIADYQRPHAIALAAQVYAVMKPSDRSTFRSILKKVAFGSYRPVMIRSQDEFDSDTRDGRGRDVEQDAYSAIDLFAQQMALRLRDGTDDEYAAAAQTIVRMSVEFAILVTFIVCSVLDGSHFSIRRFHRPPADSVRQVEAFGAFLAQSALQGDRSVTPDP